jgi:hypothetical protein
LFLHDYSVKTKFNKKKSMASEHQCKVIRAQPLQGLRKERLEEAGKTVETFRIIQETLQRPGWGLGVLVHACDHRNVESLGKRTAV